MAWGPELMKRHPFSLHFKYIYFPLRTAEVFLSFVSVIFHNHHLIDLQPECDEVDKAAASLGSQHLAQCFKHC